MWVLLAHSRQWLEVRQRPMRPRVMTVAGGAGGAEVQSSDTAVAVVDVVDSLV